MIFKNLPKITRIAGGANTLKSPEFMLNNYKVAAFLFENAAGNEVFVKITANGENATEFVPFLIKNADKNDYKNVAADGISLTDGGAFIVAVTANMLAHKEFDRISLELVSQANIATVYAIQAQPRYDGE